MKSKDRVKNNFLRLTGLELAKSNLESFIEDPSVVPKKERGLCSNFLNHLPQSYIESIFSEWKHFSGMMFFPIKDPHGILPAREFYYKKELDKYSGKSLKVRIKLAKYLVKQFSKDIKKLEKQNAS